MEKQCNEANEENDIRMFSDVYVKISQDLDASERWT